MAVEIYPWSVYAYTLSTGAVPTPELDATLINQIREDDHSVFNDADVDYILVYGVPEGGSAYSIGAYKNQQAGKCRARGYETEAALLAQLKLDVNNIKAIYERS